MKIDLDADSLKESMSLWRKATDMQIALAPGLRSHVLSKRRDFLVGFVKVADNWNMLLNSCKATDDDLTALAELKQDIEQFKNWAENGIRDLAQLATEEAGEKSG